MLLTSRCFPLLLNRTFNRIVPGHKTSVAGCSCRAFFHFIVPCVLTYRPEPHRFPALLPKEGFGVATAHGRRGGLANGLRLQPGLCKRALAGGEKARGQGPSLPSKLSTQSRPGFYERVSHKVGATFPPAGTDLDAAAALTYGEAALDARLIFHQCRGASSGFPHEYQTRARGWLSFV